VNGRQRTKSMSQYKYVLIDEFGGACRKFASKVEATPYLTTGATLQVLPRQPKANPYQVALLTLKEAPF
jgi:hypothetical protein